MRRKARIDSPRRFYRPARESPRRGGGQPLAPVVPRAGPISPPSKSLAQPQGGDHRRRRGRRLRPDVAEGHGGSTRTELSLSLRARVNSRTDALASGPIAPEDFPGGSTASDRLGVVEQVRPSAQASPRVGRLTHRTHRLIPRVVALTMRRAKKDAEDAKETMCRFTRHEYRPINKDM